MDRERCTPFRPESVRRLRTAGFLFVANIFVPGMVSRFAQKLISAGTTGRMSSVSAVGGGALFCGAFAALFFYLARVYEHGCALQEQSDETM